MRYYILDGREPREVDVTTWFAWFETADRTVARTILVDGSIISTVFIGLGCLFETAVLFDEAVGAAYLCDVRLRSNTWAQAEIGHMALVEKLNAMELFPAKP